MKNLILMGILLFIITSLVSAPMENIPLNIKQPDGQTIKCLISGDEFNHRMHDLDNYTIVLNPKTGYYVYADIARGQLIPTTLIAGKDNPIFSGLEKGLRDSYEVTVQKKGFMMNHNLTDSKAPSSGELGNLVIFLKFTDDNGFAQGYSVFNNWFNLENQLSLKYYYNEVSYGNLTINSNFYPAPDQDNIVCFTDTHERDYYRPWSVTNTEGYANEDEGFARLHVCLANALNSLDEVIPDSLVLDNDNDGVIDNVCFIVQGNADNWADVLWPHMWTMQTEAWVNGKQARGYNLQLENFLYNSNVSVLCHEMFHSIGAPDLYHYNNDGYPAVGPWDLMEWDCSQHMNAYMKFRYGNWIHDVPVITESGTYYLKPLTQPDQNVFKILSPYSDNQYFIVEYRKQEGQCEFNLAGTGIVVYRINTNYVGYGNRSGELGGLYNECIVYRPLGTFIEPGIIFQAYLNPDEGRTTMGENGSITPFLENGSYAGLEITNVTTVGDSMGFTVTINNAPTVYYPPRNLQGAIQGNNIVLTWDPAYDTQGILGYMIFRDGNQIAVNPTPTMELTVTDNNVQPGEFGVDHYYAGVTIYPGGVFSEPSNLVTVTVLNNENPDLIAKTTVTNYPNPFGHNTKIDYSIKEDSPVSLCIYNIKGQKVRSLQNIDQTKGQHSYEWNGLNNHGQKVKSGIYFCVLQTKTDKIIRKMILMKK